jgi:hypothetical protein
LVQKLLLETLKHTILAQRFLCEEKLDWEVKNNF